VSLEVLSRQIDNGVTVVAPTGRLDVAGAPALKDAIGEAVKNGKPGLTVERPLFIHDSKGKYTTEEIGRASCRERV
jgi:hypothetical protein